MNKIRILSEDVRNKIAAGEVIERPVSVVKELVENALDASASIITVSLEKGGKDLIQVSDNGSGMSEDDAMLAFERHATSKIRSVDDIISISSLGFRGEALPSIASVSRLTLITRTHEDETATRIDYADGRLLEVSPAASNPGTTVTVKGLFKNIPARRKFLRSETTELQHILKYFHYQAIMYPQVSFRLLCEGREKVNFIACADRHQRLGDVFGSGFFKEDIIPIDRQMDDYSISGYIFGLEERQDRLLDFQYTFVNGRYISDKTIRHSIRKAFEPFILKTRFWQKCSTPPYVLFIDLPPELLDVNVHPAKLEVRFRDPQRLHSFVLNTLSQALTDYETAKFASAKAKFTHPVEFQKPTFIEAEFYKSKIDIPRFSSYKKDFEKLYQDEIVPSEPLPRPTIIPVHNTQKADATEQVELFPDLPNDSFSFPALSRNEEDYVNPWQLHSSFIFVQIEDGLVVIDQHAAHERIIYEKILHRTKGTPPTRQKLILPLVIDIPPIFAALVNELIDKNLELLEKVGFTLKRFSGNALVIEEVPAELSDWQSGHIFIDILKQLETELDAEPDFRDGLAKSIACKAAIKAGNKLSKREMLNLINDLFACETPFFCPHGRPLMIKMTLQEFEKRFKRLQ
ncbi:MAG: DNA mismatch repair endonuclease MutL [Candidatus Cloacimonetes bacterium]|nr:DNA mismatch repair endonuclease MutL [Candidatus Cloacimonadota bacterium]